MSYDTPQVEAYFIPSAAFGATTDTLLIRGPKGKVGLVLDIEAFITADMVGTTTVPEIDVGTSSGDTTYARYRLGTTAILGYTAASTPRRASQEAITGNPPPSLNDYAGHVQLQKARLPADTTVTITRKLGVGGVPAGTASTYVWIAWF